MNINNIDLSRGWPWVAIHLIAIIKMGFSEAIIKFPNQQPSSWLIVDWKNVNLI